MAIGDRRSAPCDGLRHLADQTGRWLLVDVGSHTDDNAGYLGLTKATLERLELRLAKILGEHRGGLLVFDLDGDSVLGVLRAEVPTSA